VEANLAHIDSEIAAYAANWRVERLGAIDRNVLRIGIAELRLMDDVPPKVAITEAVRLAARYGGAESPRFVNGVLDAVYKRSEPER
jgi:N utilization substance protein B